MSEVSQQDNIEEIAKVIDIPDTSYETAYKRYRDLGVWLSDPRAQCSRYSPHIYPQGSFRLGTVIRPIGEDEEYDLDMGCRLQEGISKFEWSQERLKNLVGDDLEGYRVMRQIQNELEEKHRCWCLNYKDDLSFHMDIVPSIPEQYEFRKSLSESMIARGTDKTLAVSVAEHAGSITDNLLPHYPDINPDWYVSNSVGYAIWFESRMQLGLDKSVKRLQESRIDKLPLYKQRAPLQRCVQVLKRHRDTMFADNLDAKPASIIITTLAARAYQGESDVTTATVNVLRHMGDLVHAELPRIPNPINPKEDFSDRWRKETGIALQLEANFWKWLEQAKADIGAFSMSNDADYLLEKSASSFKAEVDPVELKRRLSLRSNTAFAIGGVATQVPCSPVDHRGGERFG